MYTKKCGTPVNKIVLRVYCTRFENEWSNFVETVPELCVERYGGWLRG